MKNNKGGLSGLVLTCCAVGMLTIASPTWAADITNCAQVSAAAETDADSQPNNLAGATPVQDDESCVPVPLEIVYDFGDAPKSYQTTLADDGARHEVVPWLTLGNTIDHESTGVPSAAADGDGTDEDGVNVPSLVVGQKNIKLAVTGATNTTSQNTFIACWIDYDKNGTFDASEYGSAVLPANTPSLGAPIEVSMPNVPLTTTAGDSYARCRLSTVQPTAAQSTGALPDPSGVAGDIADGEVEDYPITFTAQPEFDVALIKTVKAGQPASFSVGDTVTFEIEVRNQSSIEGKDITLTDYIPAGLTLAAASAAEWNVAGNVATLKTPIASLAATTGSAKVEISFTIDSNAALGDLTNAAEISAVSAEDSNGNPLQDKDSTADATNSDTVKDDEINENGKADPANDEDDHDIAKITITPKVDVELSKTVKDDQGADITNVRRGQSVVYTLSAVNKGPNNASGVVVTDVLPANLVYVAPAVADPAVVYDAGTHTIVWTIGNMVANAPAKTVAITATVK